MAAGRWIYIAPRVKGLALAGALLLASMAWLLTLIEKNGEHVFGSEAMDRGLWLFLSGLKIVVPLLTVGAVAQAAAWCYHSPRATLQCWATWLGAGLTLLGALTLGRGWLAKLLDDFTFRYCPTSPTVASADAVACEGVAFVGRWQSGLVLGAEAALIAAGTLGVAWLGFLLGRHRAVTAVFAAAWLLAVLVGGCAFFRLAIPDFNDFFAGTLFGPLAFDLAAPTARAATTPVASLVYLVMVLSSRALARGSTATSPTPVPRPWSGRAWYRSYRR